MVYWLPEEEFARERAIYTFRRCFAASPRSLSRDELMLCSSTLDCLQCACVENGM